MNIQRLAATIAFLAVGMGLAGEDSAKADRLQYLPLAGYEMAAFSEQTIESWTLGLGLMRGRDEVASPGERDSLLAVATYRQESFLPPLIEGEAKRLRSIDVLGDRKRGRGEFLFAFKSAADIPLLGGLQTFQSGLAYGRLIFSDSEAELSLGAGLFAGDFGLEFLGKRIPVLPLPILRYSYHGRNLDAGFDFVGSPILTLGLFPANRFRLEGQFRMDKFDDLRDLIFDISAGYRFFPPAAPFGDILGLALGMKNRSMSFALEQKDEIAYQYYAVYACLDATVLKIYSGFSFDGREYLLSSPVSKLREGWYLSVEGMYRF